MSRRCLLFALPREVRQMIYAELLQSSTYPPANPDEAGERWLEALHRSSGSLQHEGILFPATACTSPALSQCHQQLRYEILSFSQASSFAAHAKYELDVMVQSNSIYPTWICPPSPAVNYIKELKINVRLFGSRFNQRRSWRDDSLYRVLVPLFAMLGRLLHHGPGSIHQGTQDHEVCIDAVIIRAYDANAPWNQTRNRSGDKLNNGMRISKQTSRTMTWDRRVESIVKQAGKVKRLMVSFRDIRHEYDINTLPEEHLGPI